MTDHETFMLRAIEIARSSTNIPGAMPYGAVIVRNGEIIAEGLNRAQADHDPTSHGEVEAVRAACRKLGTLHLNGCDLYTSCEPCSMCTATMYMAGIERVFYAATIADSKRMFEVLEKADARWARRYSPDDVQNNVAKPIEARSMPASQLLQVDGQSVFADFVKANS